VIDWWLATLSGSSVHIIDASSSWHGRLMVLAWSALAPLALLWARYWKIAPKQDFPRVLDDKRWWHAHRGLQTLAALLTLISVALVWRGTTLLGVWSVASMHHSLGWGVVILLCVQLVHGLMRGSKGGPTDARLRGDHFDMTPRRIAFERVHKSLGWLTLLAAWCATLLGLWVADAPRWMAALIVLWWLVLVAALLRWQRAGRCVDTYQTIWGVNKNLPGMARPPIGWGVRRYTEHKQPIDHSSSAARTKETR
jgi:hypothetical protein